MTASTPTWTDSLASRRGRLHVSTAERVADLLRSQVLEGELQPGQQLTEEMLTTALGVSRGTVREALQRLSQERLVVRQTHRGVSVRKLDAGELSRVCGLRRSVEVGAVRDAAHRVIEPELVGAVQEAAESGRRAAAAGEWGAAGTANAQTHLALAALAGNERVDELMRQLMAEMRLAFLAVSDAQGLHGPYVATNSALAEQVGAGRIDEAARDLDEYLRGAERHLIAFYTAATVPDETTGVP